MKKIKFSKIKEVIGQSYCDFFFENINSFWDKIEEINKLGCATQCLDPRFISTLRIQKMHYWAFLSIMNDMRNSTNEVWTLVLPKLQKILSRTLVPDYSYNVERMQVCMRKKGYLCYPELEDIPEWETFRWNSFKS